MCRPAQNWGPWIWKKMLDHVQPDIVEAKVFFELDKFAANVMPPVLKCRPQVPDSGLPDGHDQKSAWKESSNDQMPPEKHFQQINEHGPDCHDGNSYEIFDDKNQLLKEGKYSTRLLLVPCECRRRHQICRHRVMTEEERTVIRTLPQVMEEAASFEAVKILQSKGMLDVRKENGPQWVCTLFSPHDGVSVDLGTITVILCNADCTVEHAANTLLKTQDLVNAMLLIAT